MLIDRWASSHNPVKNIFERLEIEKRQPSKLRNDYPERAESLLNIYQQSWITRDCAHTCRYNPEVGLTNLEEVQGRPCNRLKAKSSAMKCLHFHSMVCCEQRQKT